MAPRLIIPGRTYMVTRRVTQRMLFLKPSKKRDVEKAFPYCIARAAKLSGVVVHLVVIMGNHYHLIVTDPHGLLPYFTECLNKNIARCLNARYGRWENFWAGGTTASYVRLDTPADILKQCAYVLANPVEAGLVSKRSLWPGLILEQPGKYKVDKPSWFFRKEEDGGKLPDTEQLELKPAPVASSAGESIELVAQAADAREEMLRKQHYDQGKRFMGAHKVLRQSIDDRPRSREPRRQLSPTVASIDKWRRIELLQITAAFRHEHRNAMDKWRAGDHDVIFPFGTYKMRVLHKARIAEA